MAAKVFWIRGPWPGRLGVVPRPRGGEWLEAETRAWRAAGIEVVVSLLEAAEEAELALGGESASALASGLEYHSFPVPDRGVPRSRVAVARLADQIVAALHSGRNVAIHCRQGLGRSPVIAAAALIAAGHDAETAITAVRQARGLEVPETQAQREWIAGFFSWLAGKRAGPIGGQDASTPPSPASLCGSATVFVVRDVLRSVEHYRDALGFHTDFLYGEPTFYAGVERDGVCIHLQAASETKRQPGQGSLNVFVTNVDALYEELKSRGARTLNEPKDYPYGMRDFDVHDLDGNHLCFGMESTKPAV